VFFVRESMIVIYIQGNSFSTLLLLLDLPERGQRLGESWHAIDAKARLLLIFGSF